MNIASQDSQGQDSQRKTSVPAFIFDIDGVFKNGGMYSTLGASSLALLQNARIPYAFLTNGGGGRTEAQYAKVMNEKLQ